VLAYGKKIAENFNRLSRVHQRYRRQTDRRQTDGRPIAYSERERKFTSANKMLSTSLGAVSTPNVTHVSHATQCTCGKFNAMHATYVSHALATVTVFWLVSACCSREFYRIILSASLAVFLRTWTNVRASYSAGSNFRHSFYAVWYLGHSVDIHGKF